MSKMHFTILDCYTDEAAGLGVPPYIGTYPRYVAGAILKNKHEYSYITIDDLRLYKKGKDVESRKNEINHEIKTNIQLYNFSSNANKVKELLKSTDALIVICGVHTPGKYLSALPGTLKEVSTLLKDEKCYKILTGPAAIAGEGLYGGKEATINTEAFNLVTSHLEFKFKQLIANNFTKDIESFDQTYNKIKQSAILGAEVVKQHPNFPDNVIAELETSKGCWRNIACSFCTEPLKNKLEHRAIKDIVDEAKALNKLGVQHFRLGKQSDFFSRKPEEIEDMLKQLSDLKPKTLHIDNIDPATVTEEKVKLVVKYCTPGNIAAMGVESFDPEVVKQNNLNSNPKTTIKAIEIINKYGAEIGKNGMPKFLPGINLLFGLKGETKATHEHNFNTLKEIMDKGLLIRRINIRQVVVFPGTQLFEECGTKYIKKNKKYYWKWRNDIRQNIDNPLLKKLIPTGTVLKDLRTEIHDGNVTFARQNGTYPLIIGIKEKLELKKTIDVEITGHMLRSAIGKIKN